MEFHLLVDRVRGEFLEMPGMRLTPAQAMRLWGVDAALCQRVISALIGIEFLKWSAGGQLALADDRSR